MNETQLHHAHLRQDAASGNAGELVTGVLTVLRAAERPLRAKQVLGRLPGRGPASFPSVIRALRHLHRAGLASREADDRGIWVYCAPEHPARRGVGTPPAAVPDLGKLLGLGPLETEIMEVAWDADGWLSVSEILAELEYPAARYTTVATVAGILYSKDLLQRTRADHGHRAWLYRPVRTFSEYVGDLIAALLDHSPAPAAALAHALATTTAGLRPGITVETPHRG